MAIYTFFLAPRSLSADIVRDDQVLELQQALHEKDMKLTDIRLEALSSAHQLEQLRETMNRMKVHNIYSNLKIRFQI